MVICQRNILAIVTHLNLAKFDLIEFSVGGKIFCISTNSPLQNWKNTSKIRPITRGGVQGCRCTPLSSERGVQWQICTRPPLVLYKRNYFHKFLKSSYKLYSLSKNWFPNQLIIYLCLLIKSVTEFLCTLSISTLCWLNITQHQNLLIVIWLLFKSN